MGTNKIKVKGFVEDSLPDLRFRVKLDGGKEIIAYTAGKLKFHKIKVVIGDRVEVELDPYGGVASNRLIKRL